ncbi:MAG: hypothetical protein HYV63_25720 [Candidatus Schekmanbacteria bacterium]|nr:hypothetical protein [Candidatus Schekmanbacteria bacterium]
MMTIRGSWKKHQCRLRQVMICAASLFVPLLVSPAADAKGGDKEPARCLWERDWGEGPCNSGKVEVAGCSGSDCGCSISRCFNNLSSYQDFRDCGDHLDRACRIDERPVIEGQWGGACKSNRAEVAGCYASCNGSTSMCFKTVEEVDSKRAVFVAALAANLAYAGEIDRGPTNTPEPLADVEAALAEALPRLYAPPLGPNATRVIKAFRYPEKDLFAFGTVETTSIVIAFRGSRGGFGDAVKDCWERHGTGVLGVAQAIGDVIIGNFDACLQDTLESDPDGANWAMNLDRAPDDACPGMSGLLTHHGICTGLDHVYLDIKTWIAQQRGGRRLIVTGHSLGGALATLLMYRLMKDGATTPMDRFYTFAAPWVGYRDCVLGTESLYAAYGYRQKQTAVKGWRMEMLGDPVPVMTKVANLCTRGPGFGFPYYPFPRIDSENPHNGDNYVAAAADAHVAAGGASCSSSGSCTWRQGSCCFGGVIPVAVP